MSNVTGLVLAKIRAPWPLLMLVGVAVGAVLVGLSITAIADGNTVSERYDDVLNRLNAWYDAAVSGGISTDLLPFSIIVLGATWIVGFFSAWFLFRRSNPWVGLILAGTAMLTNLSFLSERDDPSFFIFLFLAMVLLARLTLVQRHDHWTRSNIGFKTGGWLSLRVISTLTILVLAVAAILPLRVFVSQAAVDFWNAGRSPLTNMEDEFSRLFSGIASKKDLAGRFFGDTLPFQGKISFGGEVVMWATSGHRSNWLYRTYSEYSAQGWLTGDTTERLVTSVTLPPPPQESFNRVPVMQRLEVDFDTSALLSGGNLDWVSRDSRVETLAPKKFFIDIFDASRDSELPDEIKDLAVEFRDRAAFQPINDAVESQISRLLPSDLVLIGTDPPVASSVGLQLESITLSRKDPILPAIVSWSFTDPVRAGEAYDMRSFVSEASDEELREAGDEYEGFIRDHYLQLPSSLPQRVRDLAQDLTAEAETPVDKALAIERYLRSDVFTYSQDIDRPPSNGDGVDWFLFDTKTGYSDYFGSAMTVMLRAVGVPARMAAGYAPGEVDPETRRWIVRDADSHGWTQVYFPGHGWIDFEPTPAWETLTRGTGEDSEDGLGSGAAPQGGSLGDPEDNCGQPEEDLLGLECDEGFDPSASSDFSFDDTTPGLSIDLREYLVPIGIGSGAILAIISLFWLAWTQGLRGATPAEQAYTKMSRLGALAGIKRQYYQTPLEFATAVGAQVPTTSEAASRIASSFSAGRYGMREPDEDELRGLAQAWSSVRNGLVGRSFTRPFTRSKPE